MIALLIVVAVCAVVSSAGWIPFSVPSRWINGFAGDLALFSMCRGLPNASVGMFLCSAGVGLGTVALGPLLTAGVLFMVRKQIAATLRALLGLLGPRVSFLTAPLVATAVFLVAWAGTQYHAGDATGLMGIPNRLFPVVVGVFTYLTASMGARVQSRFTGFFKARDRLPTRLRGVLLLALMTGVGIYVTTVVNSAAADIPTPYRYQQLIVVVGLVAGYILLAPAHGQVLAPARHLASRLGVAGP